MPRPTPRLNYYFQPCDMVTVGGASVKLDGGFGVVTIGDGGDREEVYFPYQTAKYVLVPPSGRADSFGAGRICFAC